MLKTKKYGNIKKVKDEDLNDIKLNNSYNSKMAKINGICTYKIIKIIIKITEFHYTFKHRKCDKNLFK